MYKGRGQRLICGTNSLLPPIYGFWGSNSGCQACAPSTFTCWASCHPCNFLGCWNARDFILLSIKLYYYFETCYNFISRLSRVARKALQAESETIQRNHMVLIINQLNDLTIHHNTGKIMLHHAEFSWWWNKIILYNT